MLDSNVLLSALLFPGETMNKLMSKVTTEYNLVLSSYIINEITDVIYRKFPTKVTVIEDLLNRLTYEFVHTPQEQESNLFEIRDIKDYPTLYSAIIDKIDLGISYIQ